MDASHAFSAKIVFLLLDALDDEEPTIRISGRNWLAYSIAQPERVLVPLLELMLEPNTRRDNNVYATVYDTHRIFLVFRKLRSVIECDFKSFMQVCPRN